MRSWNLRSKSHTPLDCIAQMVELILRGWVNDYGKHGAKSFQKLLEYFDLLLARWANVKYKTFRRKLMYVILKWLGNVADGDVVTYRWHIGLKPTKGAIKLLGLNKKIRVMGDYHARLCGGFKVYSTGRSVDAKIGGRRLL